MKNLLRKLHIGGSQEEPSEGSKGSSSVKSRLSSSDTSSSSAGDQKTTPSGLSGWLNVARQTLQASSTANQSGTSGGSPKLRTDTGTSGGSRTDLDGPKVAANIPNPEASSTGDSSVKPEEPVPDARAGTAAVQQVDYQSLSLEEEYQVRMAMALSVNYDPEAAQIETAKQISLGSYPSLRNTTAEVVAHRYWKYNTLNYDDKIVDGFYDVYGVVSDSSSEMMPSLGDLQGTPVSDNITWEVVLVNRATDVALVDIEQKAVSIALDCRVGTVGLQKSGLIQRIANLVAGHMGGPVTDAEDVLLKHWRKSCEQLRSSLRNIVLPLGRLEIGLARHRALLFKVLADTIGIPCQLIKDMHHTGSNERVVNIIKNDDGREYIIDLMRDPGSFIPLDVTGLVATGTDVNQDNESMVVCTPGYSEPPISLHQSSTRESVDDKKEEQHKAMGEQDMKHGVHDAEKMHAVATDGVENLVGVASSRSSAAVFVNSDVQKIIPVDIDAQEEKRVQRRQSEPSELKGLDDAPARPAGGRSGHPFAHWRSPSWTEGIGSPAVRDMKVKDVSQYMMDAAKENPKLAQKLHDVLLESGVRAPPDLFTDISPKQLQAEVTEKRKNLEEKEARNLTKGNAVRRKEKSSVGPGRPPAPAPKRSSGSEESLKDRLQRLNSVEGLGERRPLESSHANVSPKLSPTAAPVLGAAVAPEASSPVVSGPLLITVVQESLSSEVIKRVPVAAAAAATAAVVASSMVAAAAKSELVPDPTLEVPVAAAATATAAVVVATSAVVGRRLEICEAFLDAIHEDDREKVIHEDNNRRLEEIDAPARSSMGSGQEASRDGEGASGDSPAEEDRVSDKSSGSVSARSDPVLDDVAEWEIPWEDIVIGERIGIGSYGEVYRGDWHGTDVAVKKFIDQDISGDALEEFRSEVRLMRRMRHPNVVLFMGAVTRAPNLSIVTEYLPRGSLYRLIHRPNNQLDERRRMRMALDVARGMNYLHSSTPTIVHRDLKSPNLLVDKNWVVKVCDFGLSRMKHNTFLSSKSTAGTPEWMAPEVLRNEPSNEKSDVYSFGVILWELATLQQPWGGMNPMQVVGAVGFQHRRLDIPDGMDPVVAEITRQCWLSDPSLRPSFADIMAALKPLQKPLVPTRTSETGRRGVLVKRPPSQQQASPAPLVDDLVVGQEATAVKMEL